jgi:hypothetical protein
MILDTGLYNKLSAMGYIYEKEELIIGILKK